MSDRRLEKTSDSDNRSSEQIAMDRRTGDRRRNERRYTDFTMEDWAPLPLSQRLFSASDGLTIRNDLRPGDIGWLIWLHGVIYAREQGWDYTFEAYVAEPLAQFALRKNKRERIWLVECIDRIGLAIEDKEKLEAESLESSEGLFPEDKNLAPPDAYPSHVGSIAIIESSPEEAQLRWLFLTPELRGKGVGRKLMDKALSFASEAGYRYVFLWTTSELEDAARLYEAAGFRIIEEVTHVIWGKEVTEQKWELSIS